MSPMMSKRSPWRIGALVLTSFAALGGAAYMIVRGPVVEVVSPTRGKVSETVVSSGRVLAPAEVTLGALVMSSVREVHVEEGDQVSVGQLLVQLEDDGLVAALEQAQAGLAQAEAGRSQLAMLSKPAARTNLTQAEATLAEAKRKLAQSEELFRSSFGTQAEYDEAQTAYAVAKAQHEAAQLQLRATTEGGSQTITASAAIAVAKAQVAFAQAQLDHARILSPVDGVVLDRYLEPGDSVVAGSKMLLLSRTGDTRLVIEPDERNLARLAIGQPAIASAEAFPAEHFESEVQYIAPSVDPQRGTIEVHLAVPAPPAYLRPHMTVSVEVTVGAHDDTLLVPRRTVRALASDAPFVLVVDDGRVDRRPVELGIRGDAQVEILDGLTQTDLVIDDPNVTLEVGDRVRQLEADADADAGGA